METEFVDALRKQYEADVASARATALVYMQKPVAIGEHPQFLQELDKLITDISAAEENLKTLQKHFNDIPF
tara:strand:- start:198 stop:410 length:213 start_codon:yes stop_codon:yes gene_type:complete